MPFITEEIWQQIKPLTGKTGDSIQLESYPKPNEVVSLSEHNINAAEDIDWVKSFVVGIRKIRSEMNVNPGKRIPVLLANYTQQDKQRYQITSEYLAQLAKLESVDWIDEADAPQAAMALVGEMKVLIPLAGLIDRDAEIERLTKEVVKTKDNLEKTEARLNNPKFANKAPEKVVKQARDQAESQRKSLQELESQLEKIKLL